MYNSNKKKKILTRKLNRLFLAAGYYILWSFDTFWNCLHSGHFIIRIHTLWSIFTYWTASWLFYFLFFRSLYKCFLEFLHYSYFNFWRFVYWIPTFWLSSFWPFIFRNIIRAPSTGPPCQLFYFRLSLVDIPSDKINLRSDSKGCSIAKRF